MTPEELRLRTKRFAVGILRFWRTRPASEPHKVIGRQLLRSGIAVGANYRSVCRAGSDAEFISKLGIAIDDADESADWLEVLVDAQLVQARRVMDLLREAGELTRILVASRETTRARVRAQKRQTNQK